MQRWLAVDTATEACSVALWQDGKVLERFEVAGRSHTERLLPMLDALLAEAGCVPTQLDGLVSGVGPGSFAGVRIGVGLVKGMALALDRPVVPVLSLTSLAQRAIRLHTATQVAAVIDARMDEIYFARYTRGDDGRAQLDGQALVCAPADAPALAGGTWQVVGSGAKLLRATAMTTIIADALPHAEDALHWAMAEWQGGRTIHGDELEPVYLRNKVALTLAEQKNRRPA